MQLEPTADNIFSTYKITKPLNHNIQVDAGMMP